MDTKRICFGRTIFAAVAIAVLVGCGTVGPPDPGGPFVGAKMTGGGWLPSTSLVPGEKANFGFNAAQCSESSLSGHFNYHDKQAPGYRGGVKMNGTVVAVTPCNGSCQLLSCPDDSFEVEVEYRSTNPRYPGTGTALACVADNGEGANAPADRAIIKVKDGPQGGPYAGYSNEGPVQGNVQFHTCTCADGLDNDGDLSVDDADSSCLDPVTGQYDPNRDEE